MRYICTADWHIRSSTPAFRIDNYPETLLNKAQFIVDTANKYNARILIAGDVFHSVKIKITYLNSLIKILRQAKYQVLSVAGQHDLEFHKHTQEDLIHSPYETLLESGVMCDVNNRKSSKVSGLGWGNNFFSNPRKLNSAVVICHYCITPDEPPFFLQGSAYSSTQISTLLQGCNYIVSGDYHIPHVTKIGNKLVINCGSLGRSNKDQLKHKPSCFLIDTDKPTKYKRIIIPHEPIKNVFSHAVFAEKDDSLNSFSEQVKELADLIKDDTKKPNFRQITEALAVKLKLSENQKSIMYEKLRRIK